MNWLYYAPFIETTILHLTFISIIQRNTIQKKATIIMYKLNTTCSPACNVVYNWKHETPSLCNPYCK